MSASPQTQASAYVAAIAALSEAIRNLGTVPSGNLYTAVMGEEFINCADCGYDTPESNTVVVGDFFGSARICRGCAEREG